MIIGIEPILIIMRFEFLFRIYLDLMSQLARLQIFIIFNDHYFCRKLN